MSAIPKLWKGTNIHLYTPMLQQVLNNGEILSKLESQYGRMVTEETFETILKDLTKKYGSKPTYSNLKTNFKKGFIRDPELPGLNSAVLLQALWAQLEPSKDASLHQHFNETLNEIGVTCIQGISHRLLMDYLVLCT